MCSTPMSFVQHGHSINLPTINYSYVFARLAAHSQLRNDWCQRYLPGRGEITVYMFSSAQPSFKCHTMLASVILTKNCLERLA